MDAVCMAVEVWLLVFLGLWCEISALCQLSNDWLWHALFPMFWTVLQLANNYIHYVLGSIKNSLKNRPSQPLTCVIISEHKGGWCQKLKKKKLWQSLKPVGIFFLNTSNDFLAVRVMNNWHGHHTLIVSDFTTWCDHGDKLYIVESE